MAILGLSLWALVTKNFKLKWTEKKALVLEVLIPIFLAFNFAFLGNMISATWHKPSTEVANVGELSMSNAAGDLYAEYFSSSSAGTMYGRKGMAFLSPTPNHPLQQRFADLLFDFYPEDTSKNWTIARKVRHFTKLDEVLDWNNRGREANKDYIEEEVTLVLDLTKIPADVTKIPKDKHGKAIYEYKVLSADVDTSSSPSIWDLYNDQDITGKFNFMSVPQGANTLFQYAVLKDNGYNKDVAKASDYDDIDVAFVTMPTRGFFENGIAKTFNGITAGSFTFCFYGSLSSLVSILVQEKEVFIQPLFVITGASRLALYLSHYVTQFSIMLIPILISTALMVVKLYKQTNPLWLALLLIFYYTTILSFACFMSNFFSKAKTAMTVSGVIVVVMSCLAMAHQYLPPMVVQILSIFNFQTTFSSVNHTLFYYENHGEGAGLFATAYGGMSFAVGFGLFIFQSIFYLLLSVYLELVLPGEYSNPLPFYFFLMPSYWKQLCGNNGNIDRNNGNDNEQQNLLNNNMTSDYTDLNQFNLPGGGRNDNDFASPTTAPDFLQQLSPQEKQRIGIRMKNVVKEFSSETGTVRAVDDLSLVFLRGDISGLIGHNGSGKSTSINMITQLYQPTSGSIELYNRHGQRLINPAGFIGVCPQYNALYESLTVLDHIWLFSKIKQDAMGIVLPDSDVYDEAMTLLNRFKLGPRYDNKANEVIKSLSGGTKRKLCLILALLHSPDIIICDEATTGVDAVAAAEIHNVLREEAERDSGKTIVMLTHDMAEAEIAHRTSVLCKGQLMCSGSSIFLKAAFNVGYLLQLDKLKQVGVFDRLSKIDTTNGKEDVANNSKTFGDKNQINKINTHSGVFITKTLKAALPIELQNLLSVHTDTQHHIIYTIPFDFSDDVPAILELAEKKREELKIIDVGLSVTTLTDVFLLANNGFTQLHTDEEMANTTYDAPEQMNTVNSSLDQTFNNNNNNDNNSFKNTTSNTSRTALQKVNHDGTIEINEDIWDQEREHVHPFALAIYQFFALLKKRAIIQFRDPLSLLRLFAIPICALLFIWWLSSFTGAGPLLTPALSALPTQNTPVEYSAFANTDDDAQITNANAFSKTFATFSQSNPIPKDWSEFIDPDDGEFNLDAWGFSLNQTYQNYQVSNPRLMTMITTTAEFDNAQHSATIQGVIGINATQVWSQFVWSQHFFETLAKEVGIPVTFNSHVQGLPIPYSKIMIQMVVAFTILLVCVLFPQPIINFIIKERAEKVKHLHLISGVNSAVYWAAYFIFDFFLYALTSAVLIGGVYILDIPHPPMKYILLSMLAYGIIVLFFVYACSFFFDKPASGQLFVTLTLTLSPFLMAGLIAAILKIIDYRGNWLPVFRILFIVPSAGLGYCFIVVMAKDLMGGKPDFSSINNWLAFSPLFLVLLIVMQVAHNYRLWDQIFGSVKHITPRDNSAGQIDPDVLREEDEIKNNLWSAESHPLVAHGCRKTFGDFTAVNNLYFKVPKQSIVGLLGANGCGKSTTLSLLTHDLWLSQSVESQHQTAEHDAFICGHSIKTDPASAHRFLGFCPQFDALNLELTARETLTLYANFRGVFGAKCEAFVHDLLNVLGLLSSADRSAKTYSLGMRRRLSLGLALVGGPEVVIIDEASSGLDPLSRMNIQLLLQQTCKNRSVLMTSHSMDEIEALCDQICFMARGEMKAMGTKSSLKNKLGNEYAIDLQVAPGYEDFVAVHLMSSLMNVPITPELLADIQATIPTGQTHQHLDGVMSPVPPQLTHEGLMHSPNYQAFIQHCVLNGIRIADQRHQILAINIQKEKYKLSDLFGHLKNVKASLGANVIQTYSAAQIPISQVFKYIVEREEAAREQNLMGYAVSDFALQQRAAATQAEQQQQVQPHVEQQPPQYEQSNLFVQPQAQQQNLFTPQPQQQQQNLFTPQPQAQPQQNLFAPQPQQQNLFSQDYTAPPTDKPL